MSKEVDNNFFIVSNKNESQNPSKNISNVWAVLEIKFHPKRFRVS